MYKNTRGNHFFQFLIRFCLHFLITVFLRFKKYFIRILFFVFECGFSLGDVFSKKPRKRTKMKMSHLLKIFWHKKTRIITLLITILWKKKGRVFFAINHNITDKSAWFLYMPIDSHGFLEIYFWKQKIYTVFREMFSQKCNKLVTKMNSDEEKGNYKQTHIPVAISL